MKARGNIRQTRGDAPLGKPAQLRHLISQPGIRVLPGVYDCLSARLAEQAGFEILFTSGFGLSAALLGRPDFGFLTATEILSAVGRIVDAVDIPVVADIDTGYGNALNVFRTVSDAVKVGAAGVILEDQVWPKRCGHFSGKRVISVSAHVEKIKSAIQARGDSGLVIIGRTDARAVHGLDDAIDRGRAYAEAGADVIFVEAPESLHELQAIAEAFPQVPIFANMIEGGKTPLLSATQLEAMGFRIVVFPLAGLFSASSAMRQTFNYLRKHSTTEGSGIELGFSDFEKIIGVERFRQMEKKFSSSEGPSAGPEKARNH